MRAVEIENWALSVLDRVQQGLPIEDSRVELKANWIKANHAARRIAGHCSASAGDKILWLIGVDENTGITGADHQDMATWWPEVAAQFDEQSPGFHDLALTYNDHVVVALVFETDRVPFVVRNPAHGQQGGSGGPVEREVPWREGTSIRSAKHSDLVRLLVPAADLPRLELQKATAEL
ncbi:hypothetical protein DMH04_10590 [Kibdelosporangium aridum]|uniref:Uncharacterized protein n=1 Tax=Kibdelosporangium aridum TaxID=2030 RepID=A0A428ZH85_KIBAR|nr:hypothetical protein [Kibdelosporangium aridum]RSM87466.1 hypothetical protein DMH04_10590 [Kibdelosporangium aridum]